MIIPRNFHLLSPVFVIMTMIPSILSETHQQDQTASQLYNILGSLQPFRSQFCQFKFENCIQDSSYADQLDNDCNIYSRLRDCFRSLLDETQCLTIQLKRQYKKAKQNEYDSCGIALSLESLHSPINTSSSLRLTSNDMIIPILLMIGVSSRRTT